LKKLREAKVRKINVSVFVHQDILRLKVPMHNAVLMQVPQPYRDLCSDELDHVLWEPFLAIKMVKDVASFDVV
jgi:hypothetical protein